MKKGWYVFRVMLLLIIPVAAARAAPIPATSSSALVGPAPGLFVSGEGFRLDAAGTSWTLVKTKSGPSGIVTAYRAPGGSRMPATLTVRVDHLAHETTAATYVKRFAQDYARFGFRTTGGHALEINAAPAYRMGVSNPAAHLEMAQTAFVRGQKAVTLTCRASAAAFTAAALNCEKILATFRWTDAGPDSAPE